LDYPQSGERFQGRSTIEAQRGGNPAERHFTVLRIRGGGDLWVNECVITYDGAPSYSVSVMELTGDLVTHETQYFADPFPARLPRGQRLPSRSLATSDEPCGHYDCRCTARRASLRSSSRKNQLRSNHDP
jgi:hypothetical protein